VIFRKV